MSVQLNGTIDRTDGIDVQTALALCVQREAAQLEAMRAELAELEACGVHVPITPADLFRLERCGFVLDFTSGTVQEVTP